MESYDLKFNCDLGVLSRCTGSSKVQMGKSVVLAGIHGPNEARMMQMNYRELVVDVRVYHLTYTYAEKDKMSSIEKLVHNAVLSMLLLTEFPRLAITLTLQVSVASFVPNVFFSFDPEIYLVK